ncbi:MAG: hypothetical protein IH870_03675 [Chloroflexi bacterium]|nr:hypothetical protein [Chloroflexota bacterium]
MAWALLALLGLTACGVESSISGNTLAPTIAPPALESGPPARAEAELAPTNLPQPQVAPAADAQAPAEESILRRPEYDVSAEFSQLIKPHFFAQDSGGALVPALGEPELVLEHQGSIKIKLDDGGAARYLDLLALESEQIGEHPVHKIFRLEAMGVPIAPDLYLKLQPDHFDPTLFHRLDFEYQRGQRTGGVISELFPDGTFLVITDEVPPEWETSKEDLASPTHFHVNPRALSASSSRLAQEFEAEILKLPFNDQRYPAPPLAEKQCAVYRESLNHPAYTDLLRDLGFRFTVDFTVALTIGAQPPESPQEQPPFGARLTSLLQQGAGSNTRYFGMGSHWLGNLLRQLEVPWMGECDTAGGTRRYRPVGESEDRYYLTLRRSLEPDQTQRYKIIKLAEDGSGEVVYTAPGIMLMALPTPWDDTRWMMSTEGWPSALGDRPADPRWQSVYIVNTEKPEEYQIVEYPISQFPRAPESGLYGASAALSTDGQYLHNTLYGFKYEGGGLWVAELEEGFHVKPDSFVRLVEWDHMLSWMSLDPDTDPDDDSTDSSKTRAIFITGKEVADDFAMTANVMRLKGSGLETRVASKERLLRMVGWNPVPFARQTLADGRVRVAVETHLNYENSLLPRAKGVYLFTVDTTTPG